MDMAAVAAAAAAAAMAGGGAEMTGGREITSRCCPSAANRAVCERGTGVMVEEKVDVSYPPNPHDDGYCAARGRGAMSGHRVGDRGRQTPS